MFLKIFCSIDFNFLGSSRFADFCFTSRPHVRTACQHLTPKWFIHYNRQIYTDPHPLKAVVHIRVHSRCCTFCGFRQMLNDAYPPLQCHTSSFTALNPCALPVHPPPRRPWQPPSFRCLHSFVFSGMSHTWNRTRCRLSRLAFFIWLYALE